MGSIQYHLVAGVGVNRGHKARADFPVVVQRLCHGGKTVGGTGSPGNDDIVFCQGFVVHTVDDGRKVVSRRSRDQNLLCPCINMRPRLCL